MLKVVNELVGFLAIHGGIETGANRGKESRKRQGNSFPLTPALSPRERENHSARLEGPSAQGRSIVQEWVELPWRQASMRGIESDISRTLTKHSHVLPLPGGEGGVRGKALFDSPSRPLSFKSLFLFH